MQPKPQTVAGIESGCGDPSSLVSRNVSGGQKKSNMGSVSNVFTSAITTIKEKMMP